MKQIEERLFALQDLDYRDFHAKLMPGYDKERIIGVRTPALRKLAKQLTKEGDCSDFLSQLPHKYYEENNLHAFLIENLAGDFDTAMGMTEAFLPYIDNWATCDCFTPKAFRKEPQRLYEKTLGVAEKRPYLYGSLRYRHPAFPVSGPGVSSGDAGYSG